MKEYRFKDLVSIKGTDIKDWYVEFESDIQKKQGFYAKKNEIICQISFFKCVDNTIVGGRNYHKLRAPETAVYDFTVLTGIVSNLVPVSLMELEKRNFVVCKSSNNVMEMANAFIERNCKYEIVDDLFSGEKHIVWTHKYYQWFSDSFLYEGNAFQLRFLPVNKSYFHYPPYIRLDNSKEQFVFQYEKKEFSNHKFVKGDVFHFVFEHNKHLEYQIKQTAANTNDPDYKQVTFAMLPQDIQLFASENLIAIRCEFQNGDASLDLIKENDLASYTFRLYFQEYIKALEKCGINIDSINVSDSIDTEEKAKDFLSNSTCYVYLMKDEINGYHKIGISNKPEYRERTLQSEKPTVVLVCAKEYPSRTIAEAIESALHKAFGEKRIRGEWFNLCVKDVSEIITTLS